MNRALASTSFMCAAAFGLVQPVYGKDILANFTEPTNIISVYSHYEWAEDLRKASNGAIDIDVIVGGVVFPAQASMSGTADGLAQISSHVATYTPSDLPISVAVADLGFRYPDPFVLAFAYSDFMMNNERAFREWFDNGVVYGGGFSLPAYNFLCRGDVSTFEQLKTMRVRMPGGGWARFGQSIGLGMVNITGAEIYTSIERGTVDCTAGDLTQLTVGPTLLEVVKSVVRLDMSPLFSAAGWIYNKQYWKDLGPEKRRLMLNQSARAMVRAEMGYADAVAKSLAAAKEKGIVIHGPDEALQSAYDDWVAAGMGGSIEAAKAAGIENAQELYDDFERHIHKWEKLFEGVDRSDVEKMTQLARENLFDKIDENTYGIE